MDNLKNKKVKSIIIDWFYTTENGEEYCSFRVGEKAVTSIDFHPICGEGDRQYCDITFENGNCIRKFNINSVEFEQIIK